MVSARSRERLHRSTLLMVGGVMLRASGLRERPTLTLLPFASRALLPSPSRCVALALFYRTTPGTIGWVECEQGSPPTPPNPGPRAEVSSSARKLACSFQLRAHPAFFAPHTASDRPVRRLPAMLATVACPLWILCLLLGWAQALSGHAGSTLAAPEHSPIQRGCVSLGAGSLLHFRAAADGDCEGALVAPPPPPPPAKSSALGLLNMASPPAACRNPFHGRPPMLLPGAVAQGSFLPGRHTSGGWGQLSIATSAAYSDEQQSLALGYLEGWLTGGLCDACSNQARMAVFEADEAWQGHPHDCLPVLMRPPRHPPALCCYPAAEQIHAHHHDVKAHFNLSSDKPLVW